MSERTPQERVRDYLREHGSASPAELAVACVVPVSEVLRDLDRGVFRPAPRADAGGRCARCGVRAATNDLCDECRHGLVAGHGARGRTEGAPVRRVHAGTGFRSRARHR